MCDVDFSPCFGFVILLPWCVGVQEIGFLDPAVIDIV